MHATTPSGGDHALGARCSSSWASWAYGPAGWSAQNSARDTKVRDDRKAFQESRDWIYNDLAGGIPRPAKRTNR